MILVTGARGIVGLPLCEKLADNGTPFVAVSRSPEAMRESTGSAKDWQVLDWDLHTELSAQVANDLATVTTVVHCAPLWTLTAAHLERLAQLGARRVVAFSSTSIKGKRSTKSPKEREIIDLLSHAEQTISRAGAELGLAVTLFRPSMIYGYKRDQNISKIAHTIQRFGFMPLVGRAEGLRQPVHADDLVSAVLSVLDKPTTFGQTYTLVGGETLSYRSLVERVFKSLNRSPRILSVPLWLMRASLKTAAALSSFEYTADMADRMNQDLSYSDAAARRDFGYTPREFRPVIGVDI